MPKINQKRDREEAYHIVKARTLRRAFRDPKDPPSEINKGYNYFML